MRFLAGLAGRPCPAQNWAWVDIQLTTRHFHNSVLGKLGSCTALRGLVPVKAYQVMKITRDRVNTYGFYSLFGLLSRRRALGLVMETSGQFPPRRAAGRVFAAAAHAPAGSLREAAFVLAACLA